MHVLLFSNIIYFALRDLVGFLITLICLFKQNYTIWNYIIDSQIKPRDSKKAGSNRIAWRQLDFGAATLVTNN